MNFETINGRCYAQFEFARRTPRLVHAFSTRPLNVAPRTGSASHDGNEHRRLMVGDLGLRADALLYCLQVHKTDINVINTPLAGGPLAGCDGVVTDLVNVPLMTFSADCPLILVHDPHQRVLGMVHASWRCTVAHLTRQLVQLLVERFGCQPADMLAGVGPGAGPCCYEVKDDVYQAAANLDGRERFFAQRDGRLHFDLWAANRDQLVQAGIRPERTEIAGACTMCGNDVFYSFRREGKGCGHFGLLAALVD